MRRRSFEKVRNELTRLTSEQLESLKKRTSAGQDKAELRQEEARLNRIREVTSEISAVLKKNLP